MDREEKSDRASLLAQKYHFLQADLTRGSGRIVEKALLVSSAKPHRQTPVKPTRKKKKKQHSLQNSNSFAYGLRPNHAQPIIVGQSHDGRARQ